VNESVSERQATSTRRKVSKRSKTAHESTSGRNLHVAFHFRMSHETRKETTSLHERTTKVTETDSSQLVAKRKQRSCSFPDFKTITSKHHAQLTFTRPMAITYYQYSQELRGFDKIWSSSSSSRDGRQERSTMRDARPSPRQRSSKTAFVQAEHRRHAPTSTS